MQGDLISRSALIEYLRKSQSTSAEREHLIKVVFIDMVKAQPTAFDLEKVDRQLQELHSEEVNVSGVPQPYVNKHTVLRIVRDGVRNGWKE